MGELATTIGRLRAAGTDTPRIPEGDHIDQDDIDALAKWFAAEPPEVISWGRGRMRLGFEVAQTVATSSMAPYAQQHLLSNLRLAWRAWLDAWAPDPTLRFDRAANDLIHGLAVRVAYRDEGVSDDLTAALNRDLDPEAFLWSGVFSTLADWPECAVALIRQRTGRIPEGFCGVAWLDLCNRLVRHGHLSMHPFDHPRGWSQLAEWIERVDQPTPGVSAVGAVPYLRSPRPLLEAARRHPHPAVRRRANWAQAMLDEDEGFLALTEESGDPRTHHLAMHYLDDLGCPQLAPATTRSADFQALATMAQWLAQPLEFGQPPDWLEFYDQRMLDWTPTGDRRPVWLVRFGYARRGKGDEIGVGMVGSVTHTLFGEVTDGLPPLHIYALHCCWELQTQHDPRAPEARTVQAGLALLGLEA